MNARTRVQRATYRLTHLLARLAAVVLFGLRVAGRRQVPATGGGLVCCNHQSYFDPILVGLTIDRELVYLARRTLFRYTLFRWLIQWYNAIPIERDGLGIAGLKETLKRLKHGQLVLIFPEGTRTRDGRLQDLKPGFCMLARRARVPLIPVGLDGAYQAWPRSRPLPRASRIAVCIGPPIDPEAIAEMDDQQLVAELSKRIAHALHTAQRLRHAPAEPSRSVLPE